MTPVNVITGCLGAGKTTAIARALARRPEGETWAVVVNDFGALGIDGALLDDAVGSTSKTSERGGVVVREVNGGCVCCATAAPFTLAVTQVLRRFAPDRVLVEPSGVGDAGRVIDALRSEHLKRSVDVRATVCVVDVREFGSNARSGVLESELFKSQCECAETLCGSFADVADEADVEAFLAFAHAFWPKKIKVFLTRDRDVDVDVLDEACGWAESERPANAAGGAEDAPSSQGPFVLRPSLVANGSPWMLKNASERYASCGYAFHQDDVFVRPWLKKFFDVFVLQRHDVARFKGVLRLGADWVRPDVVLSETSDGAIERAIKFTSVAYRRDSRFEIIRERGVDAATDADENAFWDDVRDRLEACRKKPR